MRTYKAIVVDDEKSARENLRFMLSEVDKDFILYESESILEAKKTIQTHEISIIFLDINFPDYSGFDLLNILDEKEYLFIIVTAQLSHSIKAIQEKAFDFLLKPFGFSTLKETIERIKVKYDSNYYEEYSNEKIIFKTKNEIYNISINDIHFCKSDNTYTEIHFLDQKLVVSKTLKEVENMLSSQFFYRVHRSYLINLKKISKINSTEGFVFLRDFKIPIADRKQKEFLSKVLK